MLRCVKPYRNDARGLVYEVGQEFEGDEVLTSYLLTDAPACFEEFDKPKVKAIKAPAKDKAVKAPGRAKSK